MERSEIIEIVKDFLIDEFEVEPEDISDDANLHETLDLDSLDYVDLVVVIERNFGFKATAQDFKEISTFLNFYDLIESRLKQKV